MKRVIWKEILQPVRTQEVQLPIGAHILCAKEQNEQVCIWFTCDPEAKKSPRNIAIIGTGLEMPPGTEDWRYLGTASLLHETVIFHVFERL